MNQTETRFLVQLKPGRDSKTLEWLKLRHLIDKTPDNLLHNKCMEIFAVLGGIKAHLKSLLSNPSNDNIDKAKLLSLIKVIQQNDPSENKTNCTENTENSSNPKNEKKTTETKEILNINSIPQDIASYLTSFLTFGEVNVLQITCTDMAYICLNEMKKSDIGLINFNVLIGKENIIDLGRDHELIHNYRHYRYDTLSMALDKWIHIHDIPSSKALFYPLRMSGNSYRPCPSVGLDINKEIGSLNHMNYIMFDLRNMYKIGVGSEAIILKYFDIYKQKLYIVASVLIQYNSTLLDLVTLIMDEIVIDNIDLEYFSKLQIILNGMRMNDRKLLFFRELSEDPHRCTELSADRNEFLFKDVIPGDIIIFQLNHLHHYFEEKRINDINTAFDYHYFKIKNKYCYTVKYINIETNPLFDLEKEYESRGLNMFYVAPHFCRYRQQFRSIKLTYRYRDRWDNVLSSILSRNKIISCKYHDLTIHFEMNSNTSYAQIRKRIAFIYGIDYCHIEIWIPRSVIHDDVFEYNSSFRGIHSDSIQSFFKSKHSNFILPLQWEITAYSTLKYDEIVATELDKTYNDDIMGYTLPNAFNTNLAIYRVILIPPHLNATKKDNKSVDVIFETGFQVNLFIKHVLSTIYNSPILCDEYRNIIDSLCCNMDILSSDINIINNELVLSFSDAERCLFGHDRFSFPFSNSVIDIERNTFVLQRMVNESKFNLRFVKSAEINDDVGAMVFKFWKYVNNEYEVCGAILRVKVAAKDNLNDIIQNKLNDIKTEKCKFYLNAIKNSQYLGSLIESKHYQYFYPFTILLQDNNACINVLFVN